MRQSTGAPCAPLRAPALTALGAVLLCAGVWRADPTTPGGLSPVCPTRSLLHVDCPGCGTLRMVYALLHGDPVAALRYNALTFAAVLVLVPVYGLWVAERARGRRLVRRRGDQRWAAAAVVVVTAWSVVRNLPFSPFLALRV